MSIANSVDLKLPAIAARRKTLQLELSDMLFFAAVALLPVDGTRLGFPLPYWTPISPWLFAAYAVVHWRYLRDTIRRFLAFFLFPILLCLTSIYGWRTIGMHTIPLVKSLLSIVLGLGCLASLDIALRLKKLPLKPVLTTLFAAYCVAFGFGVLQWLALPDQFDITVLRSYFSQMLYRNYTYVRPQFLFAEPSYIGMHLFGVLLPVYWLTKDRRIGVLVPVFAIGSILMGAGTRIVLDTVVALLLWLIATINFRSKAATAGFIGGVAALGAAGLGAITFEPRLNALITNGLLAGDGSMSARIFHMLAPMWSWKHDVVHFMFGWGAGNVSEAVRNGYAGARRWYDAHNGMVTAEIEGLANPPADTFTMSAYASFITEFGLLCFLALVVLIITYITRQHAWTHQTLCWLLLVIYLYVQFEAYAFYALPLLVWATDAAAPSRHGTAAYRSATRSDSNR